MDILLIPIPIFDREMAVDSYYFQFRHGNDLTLEANPASFLDGAMNSPMLETLRLVGIEPFAMDKPVFVPISAMILLGDVARQCPKPFNKIIFLLDSSIPPTAQYIKRLRDLRLHGFRFAMTGITSLDEYIPLLAICEYIFLDQKSPAVLLSPTRMPQGARHLKLIASNVGTSEDFKQLTTKKFTLFEGPFYRLPITKGSKNISPLKSNLVRLLNLTQDENFEFNEISEIIERDPSLSVSLLQIVNSPYLGLPQKIKSISQAVTMLGVTEMRKWASTSVSRVLGSDKPDEVSRLSLIRAKFAENLAVSFKMKEYSQSLFLMGLFSVLDIILDVPMSTALTKVHIDDDISDALVKRSGRFYPVFQFMQAYEKSEWHSVSRQLIVNDINVEDVYNAYIGATIWYKDLISVDEDDGTVNPVPVVVDDKPTARKFGTVTTDIS